MYLFKKEKDFYDSKHISSYRKLLGSNLNIFIGFISHRFIKKSFNLHRNFSVCSKCKGLYIATFYSIFDCSFYIQYPVSLVILNISITIKTFSNDFTHLINLIGVNNLLSSLTGLFGGVEIAIL